MIRLLFELAIGFVVLCGIVLIVCNSIIDYYAVKRVFENVMDIPYNKVGLLLGTSPTLSNGRPNYYFIYRIEAAASLYHTGKVKYILVSGDNHKTTYNEPEEMQKALIEKGVPENAIFLDYAGFRTLDSVVRAKEIFGQERLTFISQRFHNERAVYLASKYDIDAVGFNASDVNIKGGLKTRVREAFARVKVFVDIIFNKQPRFLGEPVEIP